VYKKSLFTFGLLASSQVMLSVMPLLNNPNTVAMAQGYDIYRDNGYYSQYSTYDKKYECRTGPFEGFFVGSVESSFFPPTIAQGIEGPSVLAKIEKLKKQ
jgi:hypothetical protein